MTFPQNASAFLISTPLNSHLTETWNRVLIITLNLGFGQSPFILKSHKWLGWLKNGNNLFMSFFHYFLFFLFCQMWIYFYIFLFESFLEGGHDKGFKDQDKVNTLLTDPIIWFLCYNLFFHIFFHFFFMWFIPLP